MLKLFVFATLALAAISSVSALAIPREAPPPGWATDYLEDHNAYYARYLALKCENFYGEQFFDDCCYPMLATESLEHSRKPECDPSSGSALAARGDDTDGDNTDCDNTDGDDHGDNTGGEDNGDNTDGGDNGDNTDGDDNCDNTVGDNAESDNTGGDNTDDTGGNNSGDVKTGGFATFYWQEGRAGACGEYHSDSDLIAAIDSGMYGDLGAKSDYCGKKVAITNTKNGASVIVTVADACPTCGNYNSIDLSVHAFELIGDKDTGILPITWHFV